MIQMVCEIRIPPEIQEKVEEKDNAGYSIRKIAEELKLTETEVEHVLAHLNSKKKRKLVMIE